MVQVFAKPGLYVRLISSSIAPHSSPNATHLLPPERAALCESGLATSGLAKNLRAAGADDDGLCVREDGGDGEAAGALHIHEEGAWAWDKCLKGELDAISRLKERLSMAYLQLVLAGLSLRGRVQEIDCENL